MIHCCYCDCRCYCWYCCCYRIHYLRKSTEEMAMDHLSRLMEKPALPFLMPSCCSNDDGWKYVVRIGGGEEEALTMKNNN